MNWSELFIYSPDGTLTWKPRPVEHFGGDARVHKLWNTSHAGRTAGAKQYGRGKPMRVMVNMKGVGHAAHRIIYEMHGCGSVPEGLVIDHVNGNPFDNRIENLRAATNAQNLWNVSKSKANKHGLKGIFWCKSKRRWVAQLRRLDKKMHLGTFQTKGMAAVAYAKAAMRYHGSFARI